MNFLFPDKRRSIGSPIRHRHSTSLACQVSIQSPPNTSSDRGVILSWPELALIVEKWLRSDLLVGNVIVVEPVRICLPHARVYISCGASCPERILRAELRAWSLISVHNCIVIVRYVDLAWDFGHWLFVCNDRAQQHIDIIIPAQLPSTRVNNSLFYFEQI